MPAFARSKLFWAILLIGLFAAWYAAWWFLQDRGPLLFGRDGMSFWTVTSFAEKPVERDTLLLFDGRQLALDAHCGQQRWVYDRDDAKIEIARPSGAALRCVVLPVPPIIDQFSAIRAKVRMLRIDGEDLTLFDDEDKPVLTAQHLAATGLKNRIWRIASF